MTGLPLLFNALLCIVTAVAGAWMGRRAHRRKTLFDASHILKHSPHLWLIVVLPVLLLAYHVTLVVRPDWEWSLPYEMQFYYGPVAWAVLIGCFTYFMGFGMAVFRVTRHPRQGQLGFAMILLFVAIQQFQWRSSHDRVPRLGEPTATGDGLVFQTSPDTCVPAAAASFLAALGERHSEAEMVRMLGTDTDGTLPSQLVMAMRALGYSESTVDVDREGIDAIRTPAVIFLRHNIHAITLLRLNGRYGFIWDPLRGRVIMSYPGMRLYLGGAHAIHFERKSDQNGPGGNAKSGGI